MYSEIKKIGLPRKVTTVGNGLAVFLPVEFLKPTGIKNRDYVEMWTNGKELIVKPIVEPPTIRELFANYTGDYRGKELDWGEDVGGEICY
jgi:antitoxin component of MazEF toxin-antitoxin module